MLLKGTHQGAQKVKNIYIMVTKIISPPTEGMIDNGGRGQFQYNPNIS